MPSRPVSFPPTRRTYESPSSVTLKLWFVMPPPRTSTSAGRPGQTRATICSACTRRYYVRAAGRAPAVGRDRGGRRRRARGRSANASRRERANARTPLGEARARRDSPRRRGARARGGMWAGSELLPRGRILLGRACLLDGVRARL